MAEQQRWTAKRKSEVILQILRQTTTVIDVARQNDLTPSEIQEWVDTFLNAGEQGLKARAPGAVAQTEQEIKELKATIGDLYVENAIPRKAKALWGSSEETESWPCKANYSKTGFGRSSGPSVRCSDTYNRSNVYYSAKPELKNATPSDLQLIEAIRDIIERFPEYGTRRITAVLRRELKMNINRKKVHRIVKEQSWQRWKRPYCNRPRTKRMKSVTPQVNSRWAIDMTHVFTQKDGWYNLVALIDCHDRYLVG